MKRATLLVTLALSVSNLAFAGSYQNDVFADYSKIDLDVGSQTFDFDGWRIGGTYYLDAVNNERGPLAEAAFVDRASNLSLSLSRIDADDFGSDFDAHTVSGLFVSKDTGWLFGLSYENGDQDSPNLDLDTLSFTAGRYVAPNTTFVVNYSHAEAGNSPAEQDTDSYEVALKHLGQTGSKMYYALEVSLGEINEEDIDQNTLSYGGSYTLYPSRNIGIGVGLDFLDSDFEEATAYRLFANWFFIENASVGLMYQMLDVDETDIEQDAWTVDALVRF